jgi:N-acetyl-anhydromuramyl-L-alanine amidase AmpD
MEEILHQAHVDQDHLEVDDSGILHGRGATYTPSMRDQALWPHETNVLGIVWHYTDTRSVGAYNLSKRIAGLPAGGQRAASWHVCIDRAGTIVQSVSFKRGSWHAGGATAARFDWKASNSVNGHRLWELGAGNGHPGANNLFAGIELENVGEVRKVGTEWLGWPFSHGTKYGEPVIVPESEVVHIAQRSYHCFAIEQVNAAKRVTEALARHYSLIRENCGFSHQQIDPQNRTDPGPAWMGTHLPWLLDQVFGSK